MPVSTNQLQKHFISLTFCIHYKVLLHHSPLQSAAGTIQGCCDTASNLCLAVFSLLKFGAALPLFHSLNPTSSQQRATRAPAHPPAMGVLPADKQRLRHVLQSKALSVSIECVEYAELPASVTWIACQFAGHHTEGAERPVFGRFA